MNKMNRRFLMVILIVTGISFVHETQTMGARFSRTRLGRYLKNFKTKFRSKRNYSKAEKTTKIGTKNLSNKAKIGLLSGGAVGTYSLWNLWAQLKEKLGFGEKTTLSEYANFIPTPTEIKTRHEKMDENPNVQIFSEKGYTKISQVVKDIEKKSGKKLNEKERKKLEWFLYSQLHDIDSNRNLEASTVVPSLELLPILVYYSKNKDDYTVPTTLLPVKEFSPFIYDPLVELFKTTNATERVAEVAKKYGTVTNNYSFIATSICDVVGITNATSKEMFSTDFIALINQKYSDLSIKKDLLLVQDSAQFLEYSKTKNPELIRMPDQFYTNVLTFNNPGLNEKWHDVYFGRNYIESVLEKEKNVLPTAPFPERPKPGEPLNVPLITFYENKKVYIPEKTSGWFSKSKKQSIHVKKEAFTKDSIFNIYETGGLKEDIEELVMRHGGKFKSND